MRNYTEIRFSDTTGNGKFSGKPDLPSEIFFLAPGAPRPSNSTSPHSVTVRAHGFLREGRTAAAAAAFVSRARIFRAPILCC